MRKYTITHVKYYTKYSGMYNIYTSYHVGNTNNGQNAQSCGDGYSMSCSGPDADLAQQETVCPSGVNGQYFCIKKPVSLDQNCNFIVILEIEVFADVCAFTCDSTEYKVNDDICCPIHSTAPLESTSITACVCDAGYTGENGATCMACGTGKFKTAIGSGVCTECNEGTFSTAVAAISDVCAPCPPNANSAEDISSPSKFDCSEVCPLTATLTCSGGCACSPTSAASGMITDGPDPYAASLQCEYLLYSPNVISLWFTALDIGDFDFVTVKRCTTASCAQSIMLWNQAGSFARVSLYYPELKNFSYVSDPNTHPFLQVKFNSAYTVIGLEGWTAKWVVQKTAADSVLLNCMGNCQCPLLDANHVAFAGVISEAIGDYRLETECKFVFESNSKITLEFTSFNTSSGRDYVYIDWCMTAKCEMYQRIQVHSGPNLPPNNVFKTIPVTYPFLRIWFEANDNLVAFAGFSAKWAVDAVTSDCVECVGGQHWHAGSCVCPKDQYLKDTTICETRSTDTCGVWELVNECTPTSNFNCQQCINTCGMGESADPGGGGVCVRCIQGTYQDVERQSGCQSCPANSDSPEGSSHIKDCICNIGYTGLPGDTCVACDAGKYKTEAG